MFSTHISISLFVIGAVALIFDLLLRKESKSLTELMFHDQITELNKAIKDIDTKVDSSINEFNKNVKVAMGAIDGKIDNLGSIIDDIKDKSDLIRVAQESKISAIFKDRYSATEELRRKLTCKNQLDLHNRYSNNQISIDLLGIHLRDYFGTKGIFRVETGDFLSLLRRTDDFTIKIRILFLYPYCNTLVVRMIREECERKGITEYKDEAIRDVLRNIKITRIYPDSVATLQTLWEESNKFSELKNDNISFNVKLCTLNPMIYSLKFNDELYAEPYHYGFDKRKGEIISGKVLFIKLSGGQMSNLFQNHFDFLWNEQTTLSLKDVVEYDKSIKKPVIDFTTPDKLRDDLRKKIEQNITTITHYYSNL